MVFRNKKYFLIHNCRLELEICSLLNLDVWAERVGVVGAECSKGARMIIVVKVVPTDCVDTDACLTCIQVDNYDLRKKGLGPAAVCMAGSGLPTFLDSSTKGKVRQKWL